ncbi:hypothetical protein LTR37_015397 [Vermiconidia calcicola]|uniref:Uncharacterized protein n=1 Tax=Vermiconidia calcicola TaxID=1690605 RepID=A0ACC3MR18_9PEZI|nr:hypothetical protein LTR37_015397 [Vermiconidia calcicola]
MAAEHPHSSASFKPFTIRLDNDAKTTGLACVPSTQAHEAGDGPRPLLVGLHGGTCTAAYFDLSPDYSAAAFAVMTGTPFISINRPCYAGSTSILPLEQDEVFFGRTGRWLHEFILPALWSEYGRPNKCDGIVLLSHSMAVPPTIVCAGLHAQQQSDQALYPLAGIILTGWGSQPGNPPNLSRDANTGLLTPSFGAKVELMLGDASSTCYDPSVVAILKQQESLQNVGMPEQEGTQIEQWITKAEELCSRVRVPVLYGMGENDFLWNASKEDVQSFARLFTTSAKVETKIVLGVPHAIEWSRSSKAWYWQCFGWASEVSVALQWRKGAF